MQAATIRVRGGSSDDLAVVAQRAQAFTNASGTAIALSEGNAGEIICRARAGSNAPEVGTASPVEGTFTGLCIQSGKELLCDDAETDARVDKAAIRALGIRSMVAIPIKDGGRVVGVLAVFATTAHAFTITHMAVLKTLADQTAAYLERKQRDEAYSAEPLTSLPVKAVAISTAPSPVPPAAVVIKSAPPGSTPGQLPLVPTDKPVRAGMLVEENDPVPFSKKTNSNDELKEHKTYFRRAFGKLDAAAALENRLRANVLMIGAAVVVVIALAGGLSFKLRRLATAPQPALETSSSPGMPEAPASASANAQPALKNTSPASPDSEEAQPQRERTVVLPARPSRISGFRGNSASAPEVPAIALGSVPGPGSLSNLAGEVSPPPHPRLLAQSKLEPILVIKKVPPVYPPVAKQRRLSGSVVVQGTVGKNGRISDLQLISGPPLFRDAAFEAVRQWVFKPARLNGQAIEQSTKIRLDFGTQQE